MAKTWHRRVTEFLSYAKNRDDGSDLPEEHLHFLGK